MTPEYREAALHLIERCNREEGLALPFSSGPQISHTGAVMEFMMLDGNQLVGFAQLPDDLQPEASLLVHPDARRRGIGKELLGAIRLELVRRGFENCLVVCDEASASGRQFLTAMKVPYESSEYRLELNRANVDRTRPRIESLRIRPAGVPDRERLIGIRASGFGDSIEETAPAIDHGLTEVKRHYYLAELDGEPIGMIRAGEWEGNGDITSFAVLPEYRGRGIGRQLLLETVDMLTAEGWERILIEVATDNQDALGLYQSCGFRVANEYGYYRLSV